MTPFKSAPVSLCHIVTAFIGEPIASGSPMLEGSIRLPVSPAGGEQPLRHRHHELATSLVFDHDMMECPSSDGVTRAIGQLEREAAAESVPTRPKQTLRCTAA